MREDYEELVLPFIQQHSQAFPDQSATTYDAFCRAASLVASRAFCVDHYHGMCMVCMGYVYGLYGVCVWCVLFVWLDGVYCWDVCVCVYILVHTLLCMGMIEGVCTATCADFMVT